jgi:hypothetical protein
MVAGSGFEPLTFGLCLPSTTFVAQTRRVQFVVWTFPSPSAFLLGCLPSSLYTFRIIPKKLFGLARDHHTKGFPEFERRSYKSFPLYSPSQKLVIKYLTKVALEPDELPGCSTPRRLIQYIHRTSFLTT